MSEPTTPHSAAATRDARKREELRLLRQRLLKQIVRNEKQRKAKPK